jgi:uncharacterized protein YdbL (DUF1318 family)
MSQELAAAMRAGQVGERFDGYLGYASTPSANVQRQVGAINIRRRVLYTDLADRRRVLPQDVGIATACELLGSVAVGQAYMLADGVWRRRGADEAPPQPDYCR